MRPAQDPLCEAASIGAAHAASALARLFDRLVPVEPPHCQKLWLSELAENVFQPDEWIAGVFADLSGRVNGEAAILLSRDVFEEAVAQILGVTPPPPFDERAHSALGEIGNIVLSAAAGAFGELEGGVVLPSVPRVGYDEARKLLIDAVPPELHELPAYLAEIEIVDQERAMRVRFVWIPHP